MLFPEDTSEARNFLQLMKLSAIDDPIFCDKVEDRNESGLEKCTWAKSELLEDVRTSAKFLLRVFWQPMKLLRNIDVQAA